MKNLLIFAIFVSLFAPMSYATNQSELCLRDCKMEYQFFKRYAREGSSIAYLALAIMNYRGSAKDINIPTANRQLMRSAQAGEPAAQYQLGYFLLHGIYMPKDEKRALNWFKKSARYNVLDSHKQVAALTTKLAQYDLDVYSLQTVANNLIVSDLALEEEASDSIDQPSVSAPSTVKIDELITITANFTWADVLNAARQQTCNQSTCKTKPIVKALMPRIVLKPQASRYYPQIDELVAMTAE